MNTAGPACLSLHFDSVLEWRLRGSHRLVLVFGQRRLTQVDQ
jgi:hypothetical protein